MTKRGEGKKWVDENQGKHFCQCGCGEVIKIQIHHHVRGIPRYKNHHASKITKPGLGKTGEKNSHYRGGRYVDKRGYVQVLIPGPGRSRYRLEHRIIAEQHIGRELRTEEAVHHKNRIKTDNISENLEVKPTAEHSREHALAGEVGFLLLKKRGTSWNRHAKKQ